MKGKPGSFGDLLKALQSAHMSREQASQILDCCFCAGAAMGIILGVSLSYFFGFWAWLWLPSGTILGVIAMILGAAIIADEVI